MKLRWPRSKPEPDEIMVPFRFAEVCRVTIRTIGMTPGVPESIRWGIAMWLAEYNDHLVYYMRQQYGSGVFDMLDKITDEVTPKTSGPQWDKWESEFGSHG